MYSLNIRGGSPLCLRSLKAACPQHDSNPFDNRRVSDCLPPVCRPWLVLVMLLLLVTAICSPRAYAQPAPPASNRITINLSAGVPTFVGNAAATDPAAALPQSNWWYENNQDSTTFAGKSYTEVAATTGTKAACGSTLSAPDWIQVGIPTDANIWRSFINQASGGGQGSLCGQNNWYRLHFKVDPAYANSKIIVEFEGAHTAAQVYINGTLLPGISAVAADAQASHVVGFIPFIVDLSPHIIADGTTDNVLAVSVSRGNSWYEDPTFSEVFRFGQAMAGLFRPVKMFITNKVHIPVNVYSNQKTWGTYVGTVSETSNSAVIQVETNVLNENSTSQQVTLTTQIVDTNGNVVATAAPVTQTVAAMTPGNFPSTATPMFNQQITVTNPTFWYPNGSTYGKPYMYTVNHIVSVNGVVVDVAQSPLGIRTITWDANFPYFNGHQMYLWGGSGRYDYPGLGSSVPEEQQWRDLAQFAAGGGNIWRPGHSTSSEEFVTAADYYGIMIDQPSGDGEGSFNTPTADSVTLKEELHRDMIIRDRSHPSILDWESNNGTMNETVGAALLAIDKTWDPISTRVAADRTPDPANGTILGCTLEGCEVGVKNNFPNNPAWGAEYWGTGTARGLAWDYELAFAAPFIDNWRKSRTANAFGMAQWYFADTPGETGQNVEAGTSTTAPGNSNMVRSLGASSVDQNRFPKLLYYVYEAAWTPFSIKPVVYLAHHWNRSGSIQVNAFSNCPSVRLMLNGNVYPGTSNQVPNPWNINSTTNMNQNTTVMPFQVFWNVTWASGTVTAQCLDGSGTVVATDSRTTAGAENKIVLSVVPELTKPNGPTFQVTANGSDAALVTATIEDANGNWEPLAADNITFSVTGPATYQGGTQQYVSTNTNAFSNANSTVIGGVPDAFYHAPGDPELQVEGGLTRIALRSQFTTGTVTVTATAPGLASGSATFPIVAVPDPRSGTTNSCTTVPSAPSGLTATASSSSVINLTWTAVTPPANCTISFYNVYRSTTSGFTPSSTTLVGSGVTSANYSDTGLAGSTTYYYKVEAVDADGSSAASAQASATTPVAPVCTTVPSAPTGLAAAVVSSSVIGLNWTAVTPPANCTISSYSVYGGTTANPTTLIASGVTSISYTNTGLAASTTYYYIVKALDAAGTSAASAQAQATTQPISGTTVVSINAGGAAVSNSGGGDNSFVADVDFTGGGTYSVTHAITIPIGVTATAAPAAVYQSARQGASTYTVPGLTAGNSYTVRLHFAELYFSAAAGRQFNVAINGTTVLTNFDIYATAGAAYTAVVQNFTATANSSGQIVISFTNGAKDQPMMNGIEVLGSAPSCTTAPSAPTGLAATASSSSVIGLTWTAVTPPANCTISSYSVNRSTTSGFTPSSSTLVASGLTSASYSNTGLAASTTYYFKVVAVDAYGTSAASAQAQATTQTAPACTSVPPTGPTNLTATASSSSAISMSWTAAPVNPPCTLTSNNVFRGTTNGFTPGSGNLVGSVAATATTYSDTGLAASTTYYYLVEALDSYGASAASNQGSATTQPSGSGTDFIAINSGGPAVSNSGGGDASFAADEDVTGGGTNISGNTIVVAGVTNAAPMAVYQSERAGNFTYTIPGMVANSSHTVLLHFAEYYWTAAGKRVFNVSINGTKVLSNFDIYATAGANKAVVEQFTATANSSGQIVIAYSNGTADQPKSSGIEIR
jgi:beta-galactosidase